MTPLTMRIDTSIATRAILVMAFAVLCGPLLAQGNAPSGTLSEPLFNVDMSVVYALLALALVQVIFIFSLSGIMRTMSGPSTWTKRGASSGSRMKVLVPLFLFATTTANAQAYEGDGGTVSTYVLFWWLIAVNVVLFVMLLAQVNLLRGLTKVVTGVDEAAETELAPAGPTWDQRLLARLTRQVSAEKEEDILMHHEYDGIRELDNVLPPWWVWLFYGSIIWSVVYLVNVHVINIWPDQKTEYNNEMVQAKADVAAYMATLTNTVDENTVVLSTEAGVLASGRAAFTQYCTPCHGADGAGSETSVGPNLTDAHWIHGGGVKNVFSTIKYGVPEKGMISWKTQLKPAEIAALTSYIISLQGTGSATQKAPQGELWTEGGAPVDTSATAPDSTAVRADTARLAVN